MLRHLSQQMKFNEAAVEKNGRSGLRLLILVDVFAR